MHHRSLLPGEHITSQASSLHLASLTLCFLPSVARAADPADTPTSLKELLLLIMLVRLIWWSNLNYDTCTVHAYFVVIDNNYNDTYSWVKHMISCTIYFVVIDNI